MSKTLKLQIIQLLTLFSSLDLIVIIEFFY